MSLTSIDRKVAELKKAMAEAAARDDFETAARLRDEIEAMLGHAGAAPAEGASLVHKPPPGSMGLGTHLPLAERPKGWRPPKKPDPLTHNSRKGRR
jgi:hypothetical protein